MQQSFKLNVVIKGISQVFSAKNYASLNPEVHKLLGLYLVVPVASAGSE